MAHGVSDPGHMGQSINEPINQSTNQPINPKVPAAA